MQKFYLILFSLLVLNGLSAQDTVRVGLSLIQSFELLEQQFGVSIYYLEDYLPSSNIRLPNEEKDIGLILDQILSNTGLGYLNYQNYAYIIAPRDRLERKYDQQYFVAKNSTQKEDAEVFEDLDQFEVGAVDSYDGNSPISVGGFIIDDSSEEPLIGATIFVEALNVATVTNEIGKYELQLPTGEFTVSMNLIGYVDRKVKLKVLSSGTLDLSMSKEAIQLSEVIVTSEAANENVSGNEIGLEVLRVEEIKRLPAFLGEADVIKSLLLLPGVSSVGEGSGGINVRGGTVDQNLIMQDGMYLFNSSHVLGLFSLFNPDVVKSVNLYKGSMPARYGGRLSSVVDVELKEGNYNKFSGEGGIGLISSRLTLESPIKKGSSSVIFGTRFSFSDYLFDIVDVANIRESSAFFYDGNIKFTQRIKNKGKFSLSGYLSQDRFKFADEFDFRWRTRGANSSFSFLLSDRFSFAVEGVYSNYTSRWEEPESNRAFQLENGIEYLKIRPEITYKLSTAQTLNLGVEMNFYTVNPGEIIALTPISTTIAEKVAEEKGRDFAFYVNDDIEISEQLSVSLGARYAIYQSLGPAEISLYEENTPRLASTMTGTQTYQRGAVIETYSGIEPRASLRLSFNESTSVKMSYSRTQQFINQVSNTTAVSPVDIWQLSNVYVEPVTANNYSLGVFKNLKDNLWETSFELFYRDIDKLIEYKDLADLLVNDHLETEIISGQGRSYGAELSVKKTKGRFSGWVGYTYSRSERKTDSEFLVEAINNNQWFFSNFDRPHDISLVLTYQANKRSHFAVNFVYSSGRPITAPVGSFSVDNIFNIPVYSERNTFRIPNYHRLDISYTIGQSHKKKQSWRSSWTFSIFNVYARRNPFSVFFTQNPFQNPKANRLSVLGSIIPSINYNFSF